MAPPLPRGALALARRRAALYAARRVAGRVARTEEALPPEAYIAPGIGHNRPPGDILVTPNAGALDTPDPFAQGLEDVLAAPPELSVEQGGRFRLYMPPLPLAPLAPLAQQQFAGLEFGSSSENRHSPSGALGAVARASPDLLNAQAGTRTRGALGALEEITRLTNADRQMSPVIAGQPMRGDPRKLVEGYNAARENREIVDWFNRDHASLGYTNPMSVPSALKRLHARVAKAPDINVIAKDWGFDGPEPLLTFRDTFGKVARKADDRDLVMDYLDHRAAGMTPGEAHAEMAAMYDYETGASVGPALTRIRNQIRADGAETLAKDWNVRADDIAAFERDVVPSRSTRRPNGDANIIRQGLAKNMSDEAILAEINAQRSIRPGAGPIGLKQFRAVRRRIKAEMGIAPSIRRIDWDTQRPEIERRWDAGQSDADIIRALDLPAGGTLARKWTEWRPGVAKPNNWRDKQRTGARPDRGGAMAAVRAARTAPNKGNTTAKFDPEEQKAIVAYRDQNLDAGIRKIAADLGLSIGKVQRTLARAAARAAERNNVIPLIGVGGAGGAMGALQDWREVA